jgi:hypothetical protein
MRRRGLDTAEVDDVILGCAFPETGAEHGAHGFPARWIARFGPG